MVRTRRPRGPQVQTPMETYFREINETPLLSAEEEKELAHRIGAGDHEARDQMVRANLRLVVNIARGYTGKGLGLQDLIEEGNLGLLRAVEGFDPGVGTRFSTYASYWIKQSIKRALVNTAKPIRIPAYMVELLFKWRRMAADLQDALGRPPTVEEIARALELHRGPSPLGQQFHHVSRDANRLGRVDQRPLDRLLDPVAGVRAEARVHGWVEAFHSTQEPEIALFDQILEAKPFPGVAPRNVHHQAEVRPDHAIASLAIAFANAIG